MWKCESKYDANLHLVFNFDIHLEEANILEHTINIVELAKIEGPHTLLGRLLLPPWLGEQIHGCHRCYGCH